MALDRVADVEIVERLIRTDFDVNTRNNRNRTYLHVCSHISYIKFAEIFIKRGANVDAVDDDGLTPLHEAVRANNIEYVRMLLYYRADVTAKCFKYVSTAFMKALGAKSLEIAYELLDYEVDFSNVSFNGETTFALAMACNHTLAEALLDRSVEIDPDDYKLMHDILMRGNKSIFKRVWPVINKRILLDPEDEFLVEYLAMCTYTDDEWTDCLYDILECEVASELVVDNFHNNVFSLLQAFDLRTIERSVRVEIICLFLSLGLPVQLEDVLKFYNEFGHDEEFEAFVYMDVQPSSVPLWGYSSLPGLFALYFGADVDEHLKCLITRDCFGNFFEIRVYLKGILKIVNFCTIRKTLRDEYFIRNVVTNYCNDNSDRTDELVALHNEIIDCFNNMDEVPSLLELCRNRVRYFIYENAFLKKPCYYNTLLNGLKLPDSIKDIIKFKRTLYRRRSDVLL
ncbi:uncharacterized protein LOC108742740 [Agrilus planipennis]|uniref:Uncharacterized protein LOC108742740 n=1 Tax=Agrilus planipennis TaxID=224129 RepID=A0A1W4XMD6_AGRPL|nr:uncharacterized protein LOC108742740 [Agrilus planipennis]